MIRRLSALAIALGLLLSGPAAAQELLTLEGDFQQGGLVPGQTLPGATVTFGERKVRVAPDGRFILGLGRDAASEVTVTVALPDGTTRTQTLAVAQRTYDIQRIDGLPSSQVTPPDSVMARIAQEIGLVKWARRTDSAGMRFDGGFIWPVEGPISGVYGSQRILNGQPRQPHYGIDIAVPAGTPFVAPADGTVILVHPDMYFSGGTLMVDHGHGLMSAFLHLQTIAVKDGEAVRQGQVLGTVGATGRVTGAHLDWRVNWFEERIDAALLVPPMPETRK